MKTHIPEKVDKIFDEIIDAEGGYSNHKNDKGKATKFGVTQSTLSAFLGRKATVKDVKNLDIDTAKTIFASDYYFGPKINLLPEPIQHIVTDMAINHGPENAIRMLQGALLLCGMEIGRKDGICGPKTQAAVAEVWEKIGYDLINKLVQRRKAFYREIVANDSTQKVFLKGWLARADSFLV